MSINPPDELDRATLLEQHLAAHEETCPMCGYNLYLLRGNRCPECGGELKLQIGLTEPRLAAFYTGLVGLAAGVGFTSLLVIWGFIAQMRRSGPAMSDLMFLVGEAVVLTFLLLRWIRWSGTIRRQSTTIQWTLAIGAWLVSLLGMIFFGMWVGF